MAYIQCNRFSTILTKLENCKCGPFHIGQKINDNAYMLELPDNCNIYHTFNMTDLFKYHHNDEKLYQRLTRGLVLF